MSARPSISHGPDSTARLIVACVCLAFVGSGCIEPKTWVIVDNDYSPSADHPIVVYQAYWQADAFPTPIPPGSSSAPQTTVPASTNTAYAVLAPGWDPTGAAAPASFVVVQSQSGFAVDLGDTLHIPVDDETFAGDCAAGSFLTQSQADFITQLVFPCTFAGVHYDAASCTTTALTDGGGAVGCDGGGGADATSSDAIGDGSDASDGSGPSGGESESGAGNEGGGP